MDLSLVRTASLPRRTTVIALGACALGFAGAGLFAGSGVAGWSSLSLLGSSLLAAAAAGFAVRPLVELAAGPCESAGQSGIAELLADAGDGVWDYDLRSGRIVYSDTCATMLGYAANEITSTLSQWGTLVHEDDLPHARQALDDYLEGRSEHYRVQVRMRRKDGGWTRIQDCGRIVARDKDGRPQRACGLHRVVPASDDALDVTAAVSADLDQALAGLLGQATLASPRGGRGELERAAWRCVGLANRLKHASEHPQETPTAIDVVATARSIVEDAEQWTPKRVLLRVRNGPGVGTEFLSKGVFESLLQLGIDDAVERVDLGGGQVDVRLWREPNFVLRIAASPASQTSGEETKRMKALRSLATGHGIEVSNLGGDLRLAWPTRRQ